VDVHKTVHKNVHSWKFLNLSRPSATARAVKGGEAEAPDASAPSLEGPGSHPRSHWRWPAGHRLAWMPIFWPGDRSLRRQQGVGGPGRSGTVR
jgi:hypothetical protein